MLEGKTGENLENEITEPCMETRDASTVYLSKENHHVHLLIKMLENIQIKRHYSIFLLKINTDKTLYF